MLLIGIDIGSQSLKAIVADEGLNVLGDGAVGYAIDFPRPGWAQQDPKLWIAALAPAIGKALADAGRSADDVRGLALSGQLDGCIPTGANGAPLAPAIIWMDRRADAPLADLPAGLVRRRAGLICDASHMAAKIRWSERNLDAPERVAVWHQPVSFVLEALTGARLIDPCLASTTMLHALGGNGYDPELLGAFAIAAERLPGIAEASSIAGPLSASGAVLTGLPPGIPVAVGTGDDFATMLGCGIAAPGIVGVTLGTAEVVGALSDSAIVDPEALVETHAFVGRRYLVENPGWLSGGAVEWFCRTFSVEGAEQVSALAAEISPGCDGLTFIPALTGAMAPRWVAAARGAFYGLTASHTKAHCARAVLEGCAFAMYDVILRLKDLGVPAEKLRISGGGARSTVWTAMRADLTGLPIEVSTRTDATALGAVVLASVAAGVYDSIDRAVAALPLRFRAVEPDTSQSDLYRAAHVRYRRLFDALDPMHVD